MKTSAEPAQFWVYSVGLVSASVCSSLPIEEVTDLLNQREPTGISSRWKPSNDETFATGQPNPCPCEDWPETNKHYLFEC